MDTKTPLPDENVWGSVAGTGELATLATVVAGLAVAGVLAHRLRLPPALGYLVVGVAAAQVFLGSETHGLLDSVTEIGILVLLFAIGLELDLKRLREALRSTAFTLPFDILVPAFAVAAIFRFLGWPVREAIALGLVVSLSSTLFGERLTSTAHTTPATRSRVLGVLLAEDVAAVALLAFIALLGDGADGGLLGPLLAVGRLMFLFILLAAAALLVVPRILDAVARTHAHELMVLATAGAVVTFGALGVLAGSAELGALLAGVAAAEAGSRYVVRNSLNTFRGLALALVFFATGALVDLKSVIAEIDLALLLAAVFLVGKTFVHLPSALASGQTLPEGLRTTFALGTIGEFSIILLAAAQRSGVAHADLRAVVVGALLILLVAATLLTASVPRLVRAADRLPPRLHKSGSWLVGGLRRGRSATPSDTSRRQHAVRRLLANLLLLGAWAALLVGAGPAMLHRIELAAGFAGEAVAYGVALAVALPLAYGAYRAYRELVWLLVGLRPGERAGAGLTRARLVDAWITFSVVLVLIPLALAVPATLPLLVAGLLIAVAVSAVAWRRLLVFHHALEDSVSRVLGHDPEAGELLDRTLRQYPWGVRFSAVPVAADSPVAGRTIAASRITELTGAIVAVVQRRQREVVNPPGEHRIWAGDTLVLMGDAHQLARAEALVVASGEALHMTVQSHLARIVEVDVPEDSPLVDRRLHDADIRGHTGALVIGIWHGGTPHPKAFDPRTTIHAGDRLIVLGTPLQVDRAKLLVQGLVPAQEPHRGPQPDPRTGLPPERPAADKG